MPHFLENFITETNKALMKIKEEWSTTKANGLDEVVKIITYRAAKINWN